MRLHPPMRLRHCFYAAIFALLGILSCSLACEVRMFADEVPPVLAQKRRVPWTQSRLKGSPEPPPPFRAERIWSQLQFRSPLAFLQVPSRNCNLVLERKGVIRSFSMLGDPAETDVALDLFGHVKENDGEFIAAARDMVLDPEFSDNGFLYVVWAITPHLTEGGTRISRFKMNQESPPQIDPESRLDLITYPAGNHIGACLRFGPDGMLYICTGDGAAAFPPDEHSTAQDLSDLRGSVLRIDVRHATSDAPYRIPEDNPFVGHTNAREEIYAFGIRNGFRAAFHPTTDRLWVADVGWERCELIHEIKKGGNHGWSLFEGPYPVNPDQAPGPGKPILPAIVLERDQAQSVTGGVFLPPNAAMVNLDHSLEKGYVFGCYMNGDIWVADVSDAAHPNIDLVAESGLRLIDFKMASVPGSSPSQLDLVLVDYGTGGLYRLVPNLQRHSGSFPRKLSETGLFDDLQTLRPATGVYAYQPQATMYRGGATGSRVIGIPGTEPVGQEFPAGTVLANTLARRVNQVDGESTARRIETQILLYDGLNWNPYTYRWNESQTDADLVAASGDRMEIQVDDPILGPRVIEHGFASRAQCKTCHHVYNNGPITLRPDNLWSSKSGPAKNYDSNSTVSDWSELVAAGVLQSRKSVPDSSRLVDPYDDSQPLEARARCI
ncbi:MAG: PQQ-dependent sugar dehydrogenase [Planctomycetota bacterium]